jgi:hypothetical protein
MNEGLDADASVWERRRAGHLLADAASLLIMHDNANPYRSPESPCDRATIEHQGPVSTGWYNMRRAATLVIIFFATLVLAVAFTPTPDPFSCGIYHIAFLSVAIPCYFVGLRQARMFAGTRANTITNDAANAGQPQGSASQDHVARDG